MEQNYATVTLCALKEQSKHLKQFSDELVRSLLEAVHTAVTVLIGWNRFVAGRATCSVDDQVGAG